MGIFCKGEFSLKLVKWEGEKGSPMNLAWGPQWVNTVLAIGRNKTIV